MRRGVRSAYQRQAEAALATSVAAFARWVAPVLCAAFPVRIAHLEASGTPADRAADREQGLDARLHWGDGRPPLGLMSRLQRGRNWRTFTLECRHELGCATELDKLLARGAANPELVLQGYYDDAGLRGLALTTSALLRHAWAEGWFGAPRVQRAPHPGRAFVPLAWDVLHQRGLPLREYDPVTATWWGQPLPGLDVPSAAAQAASTARTPAP
jgi:hypothetical protein